MSKIRRISIPFKRSLYLLHPYNACLVTSKRKNEKPNIMAVAWIIPVSANPPLLAMSIRPERYSYKLIMETGEFVVNIPTYEMAKKVLICGRKSGKDYDKFKETSLSTLQATKVEAPLIKECVAHIECKVLETIEVGDHTLIIGQIVAAHALEAYFDIVYNIKKFRPCLHLGKNFFTTCVKRRKEPKI
jgi:flavin reductase (DIM6/NTAB) family NADH-FMN oxidoreductase RutF